MRSDGTYPVLRCGRCELIHPHRMRMCTRCGESQLMVARVPRREVLAAALEFVVAHHEVAMPRELVAKLVARQKPAPVGIAESLAATADAVVERVREVVPALRPRVAVGADGQPKKGS